MFLCNPIKMLFFYSDFDELFNLNNCCTKPIVIGDFTINWLDNSKKQKVRSIKYIKCIK